MREVSSSLALVGCRFRSEKVKDHPGTLIGGGHEGKYSSDITLYSLQCRARLTADSCHICQSMAAIVFSLCIAPVHRAVKCKML